MIITLTQVKSLLNISGTSKDALISTLIPEAEAKYLQIRNYPFLRFTGGLTNGSKTISGIMIYPASADIIIDNCISGFSKYLERMEYVYNSANSIDNYITDISGTVNTIEIDTAATTTASNVIFTIYPKSAKMTVAKLIQYMMNPNSMNGLQSELVGSYLWSKGSMGSPYGVPDDIFKSIKRYGNA